MLCPAPPRPACPCSESSLPVTLPLPLQHPDFAVDTHVWEITKALGWVPANASRDQCYDHLNERVPGERH